MSVKTIGKDGRYTVSGPKVDTIGLPVPLQGLPPIIQVKGYTLLARTHFHVSLVCIGQIAMKHNLTDPGLVEKIIADFETYTEHARIDFLGFRNEFRFVQEADMRSVIVMCDVSNLKEFFTLINTKYGVHLEYPPTHVTLYTLQLNVGIYVTDTADLATKTEAIPAPIDFGLLK